MTDAAADKVRTVLLPAALVLLALAVRLPLLGGPMIDWDEGVYWESLRSLSAGHRLFTEVYSSQAPFFLGALEPFFALGHSLASARAGVLTFACAGWLAAYAWGRELGGLRCGVAALVLATLDPLLMRQSVALQAEGPAAALALGAVAAATAARRTRGDLLSACAGVLLALGVLTKLPDVSAAVPVAVLLGAGDGRWRRLSWALAGGALATVAVLAPYAIHLGDAVSQFVGLHVASHAVNEGGFTHDMHTVVYTELPVFLAGAGGLVLLWRRARLHAAALGGWTIAAGSVLTAVHPLWPHHLYILVLPLLLSAAVMLATASARLRFSLPATAAALLALCLVGELWSWRAYPYRAGPGQTAWPDQVGRIAALTPAGLAVAGDDQFAMASAGRDAPPQLVDTALVRIRSGDLTTAMAESAIEQSHAAAVLFATGRLDHLPGFTDWVAAHFPRRIDIGAGLVLYVR